MPAIYDRLFLYLEHDSASLLSSCASAACPFGQLQQFVVSTHCPLVYVASIERLNIETQNRHRCVPLPSCGAGMQLEPIVIVAALFIVVIIYRSPTQNTQNTLGK